MQHERQGTCGADINAMDSKEQTTCGDLLWLRDLEKDDLIQELLDMKENACFHMRINVFAFFLFSWLMIILFMKSIS